MSDAAGWLGIIIFIAVCGVYYYFVSSIGDNIAFKIEEAMWGERYYWEGRRKTVRHYSVLLAIAATIWIGYKTGSLVVALIAFAVTSVVFYTAWRVIEDALDRTVDKGADAAANKLKSALSKKGYNMDPENQAPMKLAERYAAQNTASDSYAGMPQTNSASDNSAYSTLPPQENMFCAYCGKQIPLSSAFCPYCGKELPH